MLTFLSANVDLVEIYCRCIITFYYLMNWNVT